MTEYKGVKSFDELVEKEYGEIGTDNRNEYEERAQVYRKRDAEGSQKICEPDTRTTCGKGRNQVKLHFKN